MAKSKPKVQRGISKSRKAVAKAKKAKPSSKKPATQPVEKPIKADLPKITVPKKDLDDLLPPPPPDYYKKKDGKEFKPSGYELTKLVINLKRDINFVVDKRKFLHMDDEQLEKFLTHEIIKILDILKDDNKYVKELKEIDDKIQAYEGLPNKGWLSDKKVKEARNYLEGYKLVADETRKDIVERLESLRKQRELEGKKQKEEIERLEKHKVAESLEKPKVVEVKKLVDEKPKIKVEKLKIEKPKLLERFKAKPKLKEEPKPDTGAVSSTGVASSQHQLRKYVFQLKKSLEHVTKSDGFLKKLNKKIHLFSHKELHSALEKLTKTKEHLDKIEDIEEHVVAHASVPQMRMSHFKINTAKKLLDKHNINVGKKRSVINEKINDVKSKIKEVEKEHKAAKEKEAKLKEEAAKFVPKISELKRHIKYVLANRKIIETHDEKLEKLSLKDLYELSNKFNILKQYLGEIDSIEEHFAAESSKPGAITADKHREDARKIVESYKIDIEKDRNLIDYKLGMLKKQIKAAQKAAKEKLPELPPKPEVKLEIKPEVKEEKPEIKPAKEELEVPVPKFEEPDPEIAKLTSRLKKAIALASKNQKFLQIPDEKLSSYSPRKLLKVKKRLEFLKQNLDELEDVEEHIAAESSTPKGLTAEKQIEDAKKVMDASNIDPAKKLKDVNARIKLLQDKLGPAKPEIGKPELPVPEIKKKVPEIKEAEIKAPLEIKEEVPEIKEKPEMQEKPEMPLPPKEAGVPDKELAMQIYRLERGLRFVSGSEKLLQMSDEVLNSIGSWRSKRINKKLNVLKQKLENIEGIEEHIAAESSVKKNPAVEKQLEKARQIMGAYGIDAAKKLKEVNSRIKVVEAKLGPAAISVPELKEKIEKLEVPEVKVKEEITEKPSLEVPPPPKIAGAVDKELADKIALLRKHVNFVIKNEKPLQISDDVIKSLSSWRLGRLSKNLNLLKQKLHEIEEIEEYIAAESSTKKEPAVEKQLEDAKHVLDSSGVDPSKKLKGVDVKIKSVQDLIGVPVEVEAPVEKIPELKEVPKLKEVSELKEIPEIPMAKELEVPMPEARKPSKMRYQVIRDELKKGKKAIPSAPPKPEVPPPPGFKPSPVELQMIICSLKKDLSYLSKHEEYLYAPEERVLKLSHKDFDRILTELKSDEKHIDDLENNERNISMYEAIPNKGWLSTKKIREARALLNAYKSNNVNIIRKMVVNRLNLMKRRKHEIETGRLKIAGEGIAQKRAKVAEDKVALREAERHLVHHEKMAARSAVEDLRAARQLRAVEKANIKQIAKASKPMGIIKPPKPGKPLLEEAHREIEEAIEAVKEKPMHVKDKIGYIMSRIDEARKALEDLDVGAARDIYVDIHGIYRDMKPLEQFHVYESMKSLYEDRKSAEQLVS